MKDKPVDQNSDDKFDKDLKEDYFIQDDKNSYKMELSNKLKSFVANEFTLKTGKKVRNINGILRNDKYPFAIANIDRAVVGEKAFLECKVTNSFNKKEWIKTIPIHYKIQMNHYMAVTGASHCYVAVLIGNEELVIHKIERDEDYIEEIMKLEEIFWNNCILGNELPMPDGSSDYSKTLDTLYKDSKCEELILFEAEKILERYDEVVKIIPKIREDLLKSQNSNELLSEAQIGETRPDLLAKNRALLIITNRENYYNSDNHHTECCVITKDIILFPASNLTSRLERHPHPHEQHLGCAQRYL